MARTTGSAGSTRPGATSSTRLADGQQLVRLLEHGQPVLASPSAWPAITRATGSGPPASRSRVATAAAGERSARIR